MHALSLIAVRILARRNNPVMPAGRPPKRRCDSEGGPGSSASLQSWLQRAGVAGAAGRPSPPASNGPGRAAGTPPQRSPAVALLTPPASAAVPVPSLLVRVGTLSAPHSALAPTPSTPSTSAARPAAAPHVYTSPTKTYARSLKSTFDRVSPKKGAAATFSDAIRTSYMPNLTGSSPAAKIAALIASSPTPVRTSPVKPQPAAMPRSSSVNQLARSPPRPVSSAAPSPSAHVFPWTSPATAPAEISAPRLGTTPFHFRATSAATPHSNGQASTSLGSAEYATPKGRSSIPLPPELSRTITVHAPKPKIQASQAPRCNSPMIVSDWPRPSIPLQPAAAARRTNRPLLDVIVVSSDESPDSPHKHMTAARQSKPAALSHPVSTMPVKRKASEYVTIDDDAELLPVSFEAANPASAVAQPPYSPPPLVPIKREHSPLTAHRTPAPRALQTRGPGSNCTSASSSDASYFSTRSSPETPLIRRQIEPTPVTQRFIDFPPSTCTARRSLSLPAPVPETDDDTQTHFVNLLGEEHFDMDFLAMLRSHMSPEERLPSKFLRFVLVGVTFPPVQTFNCAQIELLLGRDDAEKHEEAFNLLLQAQHMHPACVTVGEGRPGLRDDDHGVPWVMSQRDRLYAVAAKASADYYLSAWVLVSGLHGDSFIENVIRLSDCVRNVQRADRPRQHLLALQYIAKTLEDNPPLATTVAQRHRGQCMMPVQLFSGHQAEQCFAALVEWICQAGTSPLAGVLQSLLASALEAFPHLVCRRSRSIHSAQSPCSAAAAWTLPRHACWRCGQPSDAWCCAACGIARSAACWSAPCWQRRSLYRHSLTTSPWTRCGIASRR